MLAAQVPDFEFVEFVELCGNHSSPRLWNQGTAATAYIFGKELWNNLALVHFLFAPCTARKCVDMQ